MGYLARISGAGLALAWMLQATTAAAASVDNGLRIAEHNCSMCHAIGAKGASPNPLSPPFRTLSERYPIEMLEEALAEGIRTGHPAMPEFRFQSDEIEDLIAYIKSVQTHGHVDAGAPAYAGGPSSRWSNSTRAASPSGSSY